VQFGLRCLLNEHDDDDDDDDDVVVVDDDDDEIAWNKNLCGRDGRTICGPQRVPKSTCVSL